MKFVPALLVPVCAALFATAAVAQLKLPRAAPPPAVPAATTPAASAATPASPEDAAKEAAGKLSAQGWLLLLDRRDWGRAWESASGAFRSAVPLPAWMDGIPKVREPLGAFVERQPAESHYKTAVKGLPPGEYVTVIFFSKFAQREVQEVVTVVRDPDGKWRATGYETR